jgi:molybdenum cofactor biosynthesis enzyme MoaA
MPCYLLHIVEQQDPQPYVDPDVKDVVGALPQFYCTQCQPIRLLAPGEAMKCISRESPCWNPHPCA